jgi:tetratricopeptide (TPR) repeat protein
LFLTTAPALAQTAPAQENTPFSRGCDQMMHKQFKDAIASFTEGASAHPEDPNIYLRRGQSFFCLANYKDAVIDFNHTLDLQPMDYNAYLWRGTAQSKLNKDELAIVDYEKALRLNPDLLDNFKAAQTATSVPIETQQLIPNGKHSTETINLGTGQNSIDDYTKAANKLLSGPQTARFRSGTAYSGIVDKGNNLIQIPGFDGATAESALTHMRGADYFSLKNPKRDLEQLELDLNSHPEDASLYFLRGRVCEQLGDVDKAQADLTRAIDIDKKNAHYRLARAYFYHQQNKPNLSQEDIKQAQFLEPTIPPELTFGQDIAHPSK